MAPWELKFQAKSTSFVSILIDQPNGIFSLFVCLQASLPLCLWSPLSYCPVTRDGHNSSETQPTLHCLCHLGTVLQEKESMTLHELGLGSRQKKSKTSRHLAKHAKFHSAQLQDLEERTIDSPAISADGNSTSACMVATADLQQQVSMK